MSAQKTWSPKAVGAAVVMVAALAACLAVVDGCNSAFNSVESQLQAACREGNKTLPKQIDEMTRWDRMEAGPGKQLTYSYTISRNLTEPEKQAITKNISQRAVVTPELQPMLSAGVSLCYRYHGPSGEKILEFFVKK